MGLIGFLDQDVLKSIANQIKRIRAEEKNTYSGTAAMIQALTSIEYRTKQDCTITGTKINIPAGNYMKDLEFDTSSVATTERAQTVITIPSGSLNSITVNATNDQKTGYVVENSTKDTASKTISLSASGSTVSAKVGSTTVGKCTVQSGSAATPSNIIIPVEPDITVDNNGRINVSVEGGLDITPTVSPGYVSSGTSDRVSVWGTNYKDLTTISGFTEIPRPTSQRNVATANKYVTGTITVDSIFSNDFGKTLYPGDPSMRVDIGTDATWVLLRGTLTSSGGSTAALDGRIVEIPTSTGSQSFGYITFGNASYKTPIWCSRTSANVAEVRLGNKYTLLTGSTEMEYESVSLKLYVPNKYLTKI